MKTLIIYDNTGYIYFQMTNGYRVPEGGLDFLEIEIPEGKIVKSVDISVMPNVAIFEDIPKSDIEIATTKITELEKEAADINYALMMGGLI